MKQRSQCVMGRYIYFGEFVSNTNITNSIWQVGKFITQPTTPRAGFEKTRCSSQVFQALSSIIGNLSHPIPHPGFQGARQISLKRSCEVLAPQNQTPWCWGIFFHINPWVKRDQPKFFPTCKYSCFGLGARFIATWQFCTNNTPGMHQTSENNLWLPAVLVGLP